MRFAYSVRMWRLSAVLAASSSEPDAFAVIGGVCLLLSFGALASSVRPRLIAVRDRDRRKRYEALTTRFTRLASVVLCGVGLIVLGVGVIARRV